MGFTNRSKDSSEQKWIYEVSYGAIGTTPTAAPELAVCSVPFPGVIKKMVASAKGVSGAPALDMYVQRFTTVGITLSGGATSLTLQAYGTSGMQSFVLAASGNTLLNVLAGDMITVKMSGLDTAVDSLSVGVVIQAVQDIKTSFGV